MPDHRYEFDDTNYVSYTDDIVKPPNQLLYARIICPTIDICLQNSRNRKTFSIYFSCSIVKPCIAVIWYGEKHFDYCSLYTFL